MYNCVMTCPGQPVADLESYMQSLERKQQSVEKMVKSLQGQTDDGAKKPFD